MARHDDEYEEEEEYDEYEEAADQRPVSRFRLAVGSIRRRYRVFIAGAALLGLGLLAGQVWRHARTTMRDDPRYLVTADNIEIPPTPAWIRTDIRLEVLRDAGLRSDLSTLDPPEQLQKRLADAFTFHPWVHSVSSVRKLPTNRVQVDLVYRQPLAAVETRSRSGVQLIPVDQYAVRLPAGNMTDRELRYLPRIRGVDSSTLAGETWQDQRVLGAVSLIAAMGPRWRQLDLVDVAPSRNPEVRGPLKYPVFELVTGGQTRIVWGAAPAASPPGEASFETKLARLLSFVNPSTSTGKLPTYAIIKVRDGRSMDQRSVKREDGTKQAKKESTDEPLKK